MVTAEGDQDAEKAADRLWPHAAVVTLLSVGATVLVYLALRLVTAPGSGGDEKLANSPEFGIWMVLAAVAVVVFLDSIATGVLAVSGHATTTVAGTGLTARAQALRHDAVARVRTALAQAWVYALLYVVFAALVVAVLKLVGHGGPAVKVHGWSALTSTLLVLGALAACPWVIVVWSTHDRLTRSRETVRELPTPDGPPTDRGEDADPIDARLAELLGQRRLISLAVTRLLVLVLAALFLSGALRVALVSRYPDTDPLPAADVLLYGAFFALVLGLAVIPLLLSWRATAQELVDHVFPVTVTTSADADAARARLLTRLDLDGSLFRSPIALSSVLAPLLTSLLAVFVPQLSG